MEYNHIREIDIVNWSLFFCLTSGYLSMRLSNELYGSKLLNSMLHDPGPKHLSQSMSDTAQVTKFCPDYVLSKMILSMMKTKNNSMMRGDIHVYCCS